MKRDFSHGTPEQFEQALRRRIGELDPTSVASATEIGTKRSKAEIIQFLGTKGYDTSSPVVDNYADAVLEYLQMCDDAWKDSGKQRTEWYTLDQWYKDTLMNYPDELEELPKTGDIESCDRSIMSASDSKGLWDTVEAELKDRGIECELHPNKDSLTVYIGSSEYNVPYDDLSLDAEHIDDDVEYIVGTICKMEDEDDGQE